VPVEPPPLKRAFRRTLNPDSPPSQVNSLMPLNDPPQGVKEAFAAPFTTSPCSQPSSDDSNSLDPPQLGDAFAAVPGDEAWGGEWIRDHWGQQVAFGAYPPFLSEDHEDAIDGIVPDVDGSIIVGVY
jgi:hypothetical protein